MLLVLFFLNLRSEIVNIVLSFRERLMCCVKYEVCCVVLCCVVLCCVVLCCVVLCCAGFFVKCLTKSSGFR